MLRWLLCLLAVLFLAAASLTVFRAPTLWTWKAAVVVGEYGHLLLFPVLLVTALNIGLGRTAGRPLMIVGVAAGVLTLGLLLRPSALAWKISKDLPANLAQAFGPAAIDHAPFNLGWLVSAPMEPRAKVDTLVFSGAGTPDELALDFYEPAPAKGGALAACVIVIHGGGWDNGDRAQLTWLDHHLANRGYAVAAVSYRLAPRSIWPAQREDILAAIAYLKAHAAELRIDANRLVLLGRSAGGQLATAIGYGARDPSIKGVISLYGPHDLHFAWQYAREDDVLNSPRLMKQYMGGTPETAKAAYDSASAYFYVSPQVPPTLLVHGELDTLVWNKQSERLEVKLREAGVPHVFISLPWATHAFDFNPIGPSGQISTYAIEYFLAAVTR